MTGRRKVDQPPAIPDKRCNTVHQDKVAQVIGAELGLEPIGSVAKGCGHNSGVSDNRVERFAFRQQSIGAGTHVLKAGQIEFNQFEAAAARGGVPAPSPELSAFGTFERSRIRIRPRSPADDASCVFSSCNSSL